MRKKSAFCLLAVLAIPAGHLFAQTRVVVLPIRDPTKKAGAADIAAKIRRAVNATPGYWAYPPEQLRANVAKFGLKTAQLYDVKTQKDLAELLKVDYYVEGKVRWSKQWILQVALREGRTGVLPVLKEYAYRGPFTDELAALVAKEMLSRAPKAPPPAAEKKPPRVPPPAPAAPAVQAQAPPKEAPKPKKSAPAWRDDEGREWFLHDRLRLWVDAPFLMNTYKLATSDGIGEITSSGTFFPNVGFGAEGWILPYVGLRGGFSVGFISLKLTESGGATRKIGALLWQYGGEALGRYLWKAAGREIDLRAFAGYRLLEYDADPQPVLTDNGYRGPAFGAGARVPVFRTGTGDLGLAFEGSVRPWASLSESPVTSGASSDTLGYGFQGSAYWFFFRRFYAEGGYQYLRYGTDFSGSGTRTGISPDAAADAADTFHGILLQIGWKP